ncbi:Eukaryotic/viral aspartic protease [Phytophthora megakarya]|uniref:Eukaryotic/viral aspartic protease n=1 Tax=Phytophthora megakarya TaxID=4795 RepID=A0A225WSZ8_9STRA|nr:Eukaryotic/viral aspartic protease [Phytophthora megakarya]
MTTDDYDSEREGDPDDDQICDQDRDDEERAKMFVTRHNRKTRITPSLGGDCWSLLTCQKCTGQNPTDRCRRACKACGEVHEAGKCSLKEYLNQLRLGV